MKVESHFPIFVFNRLTDNWKVQLRTHSLGLGSSFVSSWRWRQLQATFYVNRFNNNIDAAAHPSLNLALNFTSYLSVSLRHPWYGDKVTKMTIIFFSFIYFLQLLPSHSCTHRTKMQILTHSFIENLSNIFKNSSTFLLLQFLSEFSHSP